MSAPTAAQAIRPADVLAQIGAMRRSGVDEPVRELLANSPEPQSIIDALGLAIGLPVPRLQQLTAWAPRFDLLRFSECAQRRYAFLELPSDGAKQEHPNPLCLLTTDPLDTDVLAWALTRFACRQVALASAETFDAWLAWTESSIQALSGLTMGAIGPDGDAAGVSHEVLDLRTISDNDAPAVQLISSTLYDALKTGASDIHIECGPAGLAVKFRLDGVLTAVRQVDRPDLASQAINRIKVMAQLDIAERRVPQDGRLQTRYEGRDVDVRVSIMPSIHGEDAVLRVLDRQHLAQSLSGLSLEKLGFDETIAAALQGLCRRPHGMFLVTGPTGSGKTTTLYAAIAQTHQSRDKIITIEDPVEYQLPGVLQIPVNEKKGLTFARGLRSILRHDPDKILVGEIRDPETAQIAVQAALTGHLVFTTVHANTAFDVMGRFAQLGVDAYTFASAINGILAQRLFRRVCRHCATDSDSVSAEPQPAAASSQTGRATALLAQGCERCRGTGYAGRFALGELLVLTPTLRDLVSAKAPRTALQDEASRGGWVGLRDLALQAAARGDTTLEEVDRVAA